jgi:selenocysteine lyase/cysteine desulfurase
MMFTVALTISLVSDSQVVNTLGYVAKEKDLNVITATIQFPVVDETSFTGPVQAAIEAAGGALTMCIFSHITCEPSVIVPIEALTKLCRAAGAMVIIDGAHAVGQIDVDITALSELGVDMYAANGQKW